MENASKALIIAGSILLSILIIALGMYIYSTSSATGDVEILNETEIQTFNAKFEKYEDSQLGSNVKALLNSLRTNATSNAGSHDKVPTVTLSNVPGQANATVATRPDGQGTNTIDAYRGNLDGMKDLVEKSHRYTVSFTYSDEGLIDSITIDY